MIGADHERFAQTQLIEFHGLRFQFVVVALIRYQQRRLSQPPDEVGDFRIGRHDAVLDVNHKNNGIRFGHGLGNLVFDAPVNLRLHPQFQSAGIHQREVFIVPCDVGKKPVAGRSRQVFDNRNPLAGQTVQ